MHKPTILIFVEDAGAANYVAELPAAFDQCGWQTRLLAKGIALDYLLRRGVKVEGVEEQSNTERILACVHPDLVIVGTCENPDTLGFALVAEARQSGIPSAGVIDARMNAAYRFRGTSGDALAYAPDWLIVPDEWTRKVYVDIHFPPERAVVCGHPHFDYVRSVAARLGQQDQDSLRREVLPAAPIDSHIIVFVSEPEHRMRGLHEKHGLQNRRNGRDTCPGRTQKVIEDFLGALPKMESKPYLVLRLHPKETDADRADYWGAFSMVSRDEPSLPLIYIANLVVGMTSTLLLEAALMGRPTISLLFSEAETDWLPNIGPRLTRSVTSREQLQAALRESFTTASVSTARQPDASTVDGSLHRVVALIGELLKRPAKASPRRGSKAMSNAGYA